MSNPSQMPWVKLYTRLLDDARIGRLSDSAKWRYIALTLLAGKLDAGGALIEHELELNDEDIAYKLRTDPEIWKADATQLQEYGLLHKNGRGYEIPGFEDEQGPTQADKRAAWKERQDRHRGEKTCHG